MLDELGYRFTSLGLRALVGAGVMVFTGALAWAILSLPPDTPGLVEEVERNLGASGVDSQVTAVLLNFRAYDTFLEIVVLLVAIMGLRAIRLGSNEPIPEQSEFSPVLFEFVRFLAPIMIVLAGYLLWAGSKYPGGAFQAGAVLGAAGILLHISERIRVGSLRRWHERGLLSAGVIVFALAGLVCMAYGGAFLEYPANGAKPLILLIETAATISIAATFVVLFAGRSLANPRDAEIVEAEDPHA